MIASGCTDEVGGDGYEPPRPTAGTNGDGGVVNAGGMDDDGGAPLQPGAGKGGSSGGSAGKASGGKSSGGKASGGKGGGGSVTEGGGGAGETPSAVCGNMAIEEGEQCDDGNTKSGDGCTADCKSDCEVCEKTFCKNVHSAEAGEHNPVYGELFEPFDPFTACFAAEGLAVAGPAKGISLAVLCQDLVDCVRREQCAQFEDIDGSAATGYGFVHCYCSYDVSLLNYKTTCEATTALDPKVDPNYVGKCLREFQEASETEDALGLFKGVQNRRKALGVANLLLLTCDRSLCTEECLPQISTGVVGQITADIVVANNDAGESPFGDLMADSQRAATGTDFAFVRNSAFQPVTEAAQPSGLIFHGAQGRPADADGRVLHSEVRQVIFGYYSGTFAGSEFNVGSHLVTLKATGQQIYDLLEQASASTPLDTFLQVSGLTFKWQSEAPRIQEVRKDGALLDKAAKYSVTIDNVLSALSRAPLTGATDLVATDKTPEQALIGYLKSLPQPMSPPALDRITLLPPTPKP
jgi:cysteine-rich repeat protein